MPTSRRSVIQSITSAAIGLPAAAQHNHPAANEFAQISGTQTPYKPKFFSAQEFETVKILVDLILPRTDTPGGADAGAHRIIDTNVSRVPAVQKSWRGGLAWLEAEARKAGGKTFQALPRDKQISILQVASEMKTGPQFFAVLKGATVDAYYSTREGLSVELGWNANTFLPEFKGCTHKEHQG